MKILSNVSFVDILFYTINYVKNVKEIIRRELYNYFKVYFERYSEKEMIIRKDILCK